MAVSSVGIHEDTATELDELEINRMSNWTSTAGYGQQRRTAKVTKHHLHNQYFKKEVVVQSSSDRLVFVGPSRYIYGCGEQHA